MFLLIAALCILKSTIPFQFNITTEATNSYFHKANDNIFFQIPLPRLAFLVHSTNNLIISVNVNDVKKDGRSNNSDCNNIKHMGFVGPYSKSFGVFFGDNTGSISIRCNNDTLLSFSTIFIPPECDVVHISSTPNELLDMYSRSLINKKAGRDTLEPNKTICVWHTTIETVNTSIETNNVNESNVLSLDYISPTYNFQHNINSDDCNQSAYDEDYEDKYQHPVPPTDFEKNGSLYNSEQLSEKKINNFINNNSADIHNRKLNDDNYQEDDCYNYKYPKYRNLNEDKEYNLDGNKDGNHDDGKDKGHNKRPPPFDGGNRRPKHHERFECSNYFHYGWSEPKNDTNTPNHNETTATDIFESSYQPTESVIISQLEQTETIESTETNLEPIESIQTNSFLPPTKTEISLSPTETQSNPTESNTPSISIPTKLSPPPHSFSHGWSHQPRPPRTIRPSKSPKPTNTTPTPRPTKSPKPTNKPPPRPPFNPHPPDFDFIGNKNVRARTSSSTLMTDNLHSGNTFIFLRINQDIPNDASVIIKTINASFLNQVNANRTGSHFHSTIFPSQKPQFLIDEIHFPGFPGKGDWMPPRPDFDPDDDFGDSDHGRPNKSKFYIFGHEQVYSKFKAIIILQFVVCFVCLVIIIFCVIYVLNRKKYNEFKKRQFQMVLKEQREIELGMKKAPHIPQANNPLPQASIFVERANIINNQSFGVMSDTHDDDNNNKWTIDEISDMSSN